MISSGVRTQNSVAISGHNVEMGTERSRPDLTYWKRLLRPKALAVEVYVALDKGLIGFSLLF